MVLASVTHTYTHTHTHTYIYREDSSVSSRYARAQRSDEIDAKFGFERYLGTTDRMGWLINMHPVGGVF